MADKIFVGSCKTRETQYGNLTSIGFTEEHLNLLREHLNGGWVNLNLKFSKENTPYLEINTFKANGRSAAPKPTEDDKVRKTKADIEKEANNACTSDDDLPF